MKGWNMMISIFGTFAFVIKYIVIPVVIAFMLFWIREIKINSEIQVKQNEEIIELMKKLNK
jgi:hypothetical protein